MSIHSHCQCLAANCGKFISVSVYQHLRVVILCITYYVLQHNFSKKKSKLGFSGTRAPCVYQNPKLKLISSHERGWGGGGLEKAPISVLYL